MDNQKLAYTDSLVDITEDAISFKNYYYPSSNTKVLSFSDVSNVRVAKPTLGNGKWRLWGTGNIVTWFPKDFERPSRSDIFFVKPQGAWITIGFTVENAAAVKEILSRKGLLSTSSG